MSQFTFRIFLEYGSPTPHLHCYYAWWISEDFIEFHYQWYIIEEMPRPHAKHHDGLYPTYPKLPNIFRGQVNVWKQPRDLGGIQDLILSWKQAASNINLIQYRCNTLEKNKWWQMWRYALVETRRLGSWKKVFFGGKTKKRKQTTHPVSRMPQVPLSGRSLTPQILPLDTSCHQTRQIQ